MNLYRFKKKTSNSTDYRQLVSLNKIKQFFISTKTKR